MAIATSANREKLLALGASGFWCMTQFSEIQNFYGDNANNAACDEAVRLYGIPPANRPSERKWGGWNDFCDWDRGYYKVYLAAKFYSQHPPLDLSATKNCAEIKETIANLDRFDRENALQIKAAGADPAKGDYLLEIINDYQSKLSAAYAKMSCDKVLLDEQKKELVEDVNQTAKDNPAGASSKVGIYILYAVVILVAAVAVKKLILNK
jgi:hypothetical protein